jgi:hypothetical protein
MMLEKFPNSCRKSTAAIEEAELLYTAVSDNGRGVILLPQAPLPRIYL